MQTKTKSIAKQIQPRLGHVLRWSNRSNPNRMVSFGLLVCACYLPTWLTFMGLDIANGSSFPLLNFGFLYFGIQAIRQHHKSVQRPPSPLEDVWLGGMITLGCGILYFVCLGSSSLQALSCAGVVIGLLFMLYGGAILRAYPLKLSLLLLSLYPDLGFLFNSLRILSTGDLLERNMARAGSWGLRLIGQTASFDGVFVTLGPGAVEVGPGCTGFDMAVPIAGFALMLGLFFELRWTKILWLGVIGVILSLILNVPRIVLLANAAVYWGEHSFEFWHSSWGAQIFSGLLFTIYYYITTPLLQSDTQ